MIWSPQHTEAGVVLRRMRRPLWRAMWRAERIVRRETEKAFMDSVVFGAGYTQPGDLGEWRRDGSDIVRHIPTPDIWKAETA